MELIEQRNDLDCGYAVASMLAGRPYEDLEGVDKNPTAMRGFSVPEMLGVLLALTGDTWKESQSNRGKLLKDLKMPDFECGLVIRRVEDKVGHWVAWDGEFIYDPEAPSKFPMHEYIRSHWQLIRIVKRVSL